MRPCAGTTHRMTPNRTHPNPLAPLPQTSVFPYRGWMDASLFHNERRCILPKYIDWNVFPFKELIGRLFNSRVTALFGDVVMNHEESSGNYPVPEVFKGRPF